MTKGRVSLRKVYDFLVDRIFLAVAAVRPSFRAISFSKGKLLPDRLRGTITDISYHFVEALMQFQLISLNVSTTFINDAFECARRRALNLDITDARLGSFSDLISNI